MSEQRGAFVVRPGEGATVEGPVGGPIEFKVRGEDSGGAMTAFVNRVSPGEGPPHHYHEHEDEAWYIIDGEFRFKLGDELSDAPAGSFVFVPRGVSHSFQNVGPEAARILVLFAPSGMERFFDAFSRLAPDEVKPSVFAEIGGELGMHVVGPPLAKSDPS